MSTEEIFAHNIKWLRKYHGLSQKNMAKLLGIGIWSLRKLEKGEIPPRLTIEVVFAVYKNFGVRPSVQFGSCLGQ